VDEVELPRSLEPGQALVKVHASGICGSQLGEIDGVKGEDRYLPHLLGHEGSGTVIEAGPGVRHVKAGDKVVLHWRKGAGIEAAPAKYQWRGKPLNAGWVTTFQQYAVVSENRLTAIPADSDMEVAALFGCAVTTGFGVVTNNARLSIGESVVVFGAGGIGLNIVQAAALVTAQPIIAVDLHDSRLELARQFGATHTINSRRSQAREEIQRLCPGGVDAFIDNTGNPDIIAMGYELTKPAGRVVLVGVPAKGRNVSLYSLPLHFGKELRGSHGGDAVPQVDIPRYASLYRSGRIKLKELLTERFPLADINTAIERMRDGRLAGRCSIQMDR
ncbi:MAG TPA: zinc-binding dehydrogenase, partial [Burkholderiales bacterium]|nr:zinc-binding dehydrogenase [Burkholderiales bacterium]